MNKILFFLFVVLFEYTNIFSMPNISIFNYKSIRDFSHGTCSQKVGEYNIVGANGGAVVEKDEVVEYLKGNLFNCSVIRTFNDSIAYLGTKQNGLYSYNVYTKEFVQSSFYYDVNIYDIAKSGGVLYLATDKGLALTELNSLSPIDFIYHGYNNVNPAIYRITIINDSIFVKGDDSVYFGSINSFLGSGSSWNSVVDTSFNRDVFGDVHPFDGLLENEILTQNWYHLYSDALVFNDKLLLGSYEKDRSFLYLDNYQLVKLYEDNLNPCQLINMENRYVYGATGESGLLEVDNNLSVKNYGFGDFPSTRVNFVSIADDSNIVVTLKPQSKDNGTTLFFEGGVALFNVYTKKSMVFTNDTNNVIDGGNSYVYSSSMPQKKFNLISSVKFPASWWNELYYSFFLNGYFVIITADANLYVYNTNNTLTNIADDSLIYSENLTIGLPKNGEIRNSSVYLYNEIGVEKISVNKKVTELVRKFDDQINNLHFYNDTIVALATNSGVKFGVLDSQLASFEVFKEIDRNSGLSSNSIKDVLFNKNSIYFFGEQFIDIAKFNFVSDSLVYERNQHNVYPNPLYLNQSDFFVVDNVKKGSILALYSISGKLLYKRVVEKNEPIVKVYPKEISLSSGIYIVVITNQDKKELYKIVVL